MEIDRARIWCPQKHDGDPSVIVQTFKWSERDLGDFGPERWGWVFEDVTPFEQRVPFTGKQGLFDVIFTKASPSSPIVAIEPKIVEFTHYAIYDHPADDRQHFVVRKHYGTLAREVLPDAWALEFNSLGAARASLPKGLRMIHRLKGDDACLIETWI